MGHSEDENPYSLLTPPRFRIQSCSAKVVRPYQPGAPSIRAAIVLSILFLTACSSAQPRANGSAAVAADSVAWVAGTPLPSGRDHHGTFITSGGNNARLWVIGGND